MYRSLYFKIILIFVMLMVAVMAVVGTVLLSSVYNFYAEEFVAQLDDCFESGLRTELENTLSRDGWVSEQKSILGAYSTYLGIDVYRNYYILDVDGDFLDGSNEELGTSLVRTPNIIQAMLGSDCADIQPGESYSDYAVALHGNGGELSCIIYIKDTQEEMRGLSRQLFLLILEAVLFGIAIAIVLSFFLARAITGPIRRLTDGVQLLMDGHFSRIQVHSNDEIGTLTDSFNDMGLILRSNMEEISGERMKLETIFSCLNDAVIAFRDDGTVLNINKSAVTLFADVYSDSFSADTMLHALGAEYAAAYIRELRGRRQSGEYRLNDIEYGSSVFDMSIGNLRYSEKNTTRSGCVVVLHNVTERYELVKSQREFVANVSHELGTPLSIIRGAAESVQLNPDMDSSIREGFINMAVDECERMKHIIDDLLTLSRFDNNRTRWNVTDFDYSKSVLRVCGAMKTVADRHGHTINVDAGEGIMLHGDRERIEQVMINVISNSIKYTPEGGKIDVRLKPDGDNVMLYVRDNGVGIPEEDMARLFERFYRVEKSRTSGKGGTGLGLAITKEIVEAHGGTVNVKSKVGYGTLMTILLPKICNPGGSGI